MRIIVLALILLAVIGLWWFFRARTKEAAQQEATSAGTDAGRRLRSRMLSAPPESFGVTPTAAFPRIFAVLMDWPVGKDVVTVFSAHDGTASLYTTFSFGMIGAGEVSASVRAAATAFVQMADHFFDSSTPTTTFPYPTSDQVRFHLLTYDGVRVIVTARVPLEQGTSEYSGLFNQGQAVLTEIRRSDNDR